MRCLSDRASNTKSLPEDEEKDRVSLDDFERGAIVVRLFDVFSVSGLFRCLSKCSVKRLR